MIVGLHAVKEDGFKGSTPFVKFEGYRRLVGQSQSRDFLAWTKADAHRIVMPDARNPASRKSTVQGPPNPRLALSRLHAHPARRPARRRRARAGQAGIGWTEICTSRDGENWTRWREPFSERDPRGRLRSRHGLVRRHRHRRRRGLYLLWRLLRGHKADAADRPRQLRRNGFVSRRAVAGEGVIQDTGGDAPGYGPDRRWIKTASCVCASWIKAAMP